MKTEAFSIAPDAAAEVIGTDVLVYLSESSEVIRLSGVAAEAFLAIRAGQRVDPSDEGVRQLVAAGVARSVGLSRRGLVKAGAVGVGTGVVVMAMPSLAAASSGSGIPIAGFYFMAGEGNPWGFIVSKDDVSAGTPETLTLAVSGTDFQSSAQTSVAGTGWSTGSSAAISYTWNAADDHWLHGVLVSGALQDALGDPLSGSFSSGGTTYDVTYSFRESNSGVLPPQ
jgi:hypothetical protein